MSQSNIGSNNGYRGRGKAAPYETLHYRIPLPIKPIVEKMANRYRELVGEFEHPQDPELLVAVIDAIASDKNQEIEQLRNELISLKEKFDLLQNSQKLETKEQVKKTLSQEKWEPFTITIPGKGTGTISLIKIYKKYAKVSISYVFFDGNTLTQEAHPADLKEAEAIALAELNKYEEAPNIT